jgi:hypothetical protein
MILMTVLLLLVGAAGRIAPVRVLIAVCLLGFLPALAWVVWRYRQWVPPPTDAHIVKEQSLWSRLVMGAVPVAFIASPLRGEWLVANRLPRKRTHPPLSALGSAG